MYQRIGRSVQYTVLRVAILSSIHGPQPIGRRFDVHYGNQHDRFELFFRQTLWRKRCCGGLCHTHDVVVLQLEMDCQSTYAPLFSH